MTTFHKLSASKSRLTKSQMYLLEKGEFSCRDLEKLVGQYFDRELPRALQTRVQEHIESCPACEQFAGSYHLVIELARELGRERDLVSTVAPLPDGETLPTPVKSRLTAHLNKTLGLTLSAE
jgi:hypothetical protein